MKSYTVRVWEEDCGAFIFHGIEAEHKNGACCKAIDTYMLFVEETEIKALTASATLEK